MNRSPTNSLLTYKGYVGSVELDAEVGILGGTVLGVRDVIHFEGDTVAEVTRAFRDSVDDYLAYCERLGRKPEKPKSGKFNLRIDPRTHRMVELAAVQRGLSMNEWIEEHLEADARRELGEVVEM